MSRPPGTPAQDGFLRFYWSFHAASSLALSWFHRCPWACPCACFGVELRCLLILLELSSLSGWGSSARAHSRSEKFDESSARMGSTARASPHFPGWALRANLNFSSWRDVLTFADSVETSLARLFSEIPTGFATDVSDSITAPTFSTSTVFSLNPTLDPSDLELFDCSVHPRGLTTYVSL